MISIILFIIVCIIWDAFKKLIRGPRTPNVTLKKVETSKASCGCLTFEHQVVDPCKAHRLILGMGGN